MLVSTPDYTLKQINTSTAKTTMVGADSFGIADSADSGKIKRVTLTQLLATTDAQATTTTSGVVELATDAEVITGTDATRYVTPLQMKMTVIASTTNILAQSAGSVTTAATSYTKVKEITLAI